MEGVETPQASETNVPQRIDEIESQIAELRVGMAASKPVGEIVKYLLLFWLTLSVALGIFGWAQLSDIDDEIATTVSEQITLQFPEDSQQYREYQRLLTDTEMLYGNFVELTKEYKERVEDLHFAEVIASEFDIIGQVDEIIDEISVTRNRVDSYWRTKAITVLKRFEETISDTSYPADVVFNVAQVARELKQFQIAADLTHAAYEKDGSPAFLALKLSSEVANSTGDERASSYAKLIDMVRNLDPESNPHIVVSEAWNASETTRNYGPLITAIDELIDRAGERYVPSYVYAVKAGALLRRSWTGDKDLARRALENGYELFKMESSWSLWNKSFVDDYLLLSVVIDDSREIEVGEISLTENDQGQQADVVDREDALMTMLDEILPTSQGYDIAEIVLGERQIVDHGEGVFFQFVPEASGVYIVGVGVGVEDVDPMVFVRDSSERLLGFDDDGGEGLGARLEIELKRGDVYDIGVSSADYGSVLGAVVAISHVGRRSTD